MTPRTLVLLIGLTALLVGLACQEVGASFAVMLFPETGPLGIVMLRLLFSAVLLLIIARPRLRGHTGYAWRSVVGFGVVLASMNGLFYLALERLPLGVTVTIEVLGPLTLSILTATGVARWVWAGLALGGVVALGAGGWDRLDALGVLFALGAAVSWRCTSSRRRGWVGSSRGSTVSPSRWPWGASSLCRSESPKQDPSWCASTSSPWVPRSRCCRRPSPTPSS